MTALGRRYARFYVDTPERYADVPESGA